MPTPHLLHHLLHIKYYHLLFGEKIRSVWPSKSHEAIHHCNVRVRRRTYRRKIQSQQELLSSPFSKNQRHQRLDHGCWHCMCLSAPYSLLVPSHSASASLLSLYSRYALVCNHSPACFALPSDAVCDYSGHNSVHLLQYTANE